MCMSRDGSYYTKWDSSYHSRLLTKLYFIIFSGLKMEDSEMNKVFTSNITRNVNLDNNDLYKLLSISPATPIQMMNDISDTTLCSFHPNTDKYYIPKKRSRLKVKTVRDIRNAFEIDVYNNLPTEIEKQENVLLKNIKDGSSTNEQFKNILKNMLSAENPISRTAWQMLINLNPDNHKHSKQYVLCNGQYIHVNGSKGGRTKFICNYDLGNIDKRRYKKVNVRNTTKKIGLLKNSLHVKFKPGPLGIKKYLDDSYQNHNIGEIELIHLPKPSLDVQPMYGVPFDVNLTHFLNNWRDNSGKISQKWAEFSASVVGIIKNTKAVQNEPHSKINFGLNYRFLQNRILMRRDVEKAVPKKSSVSDLNISTHDSIMSEVREIVNKMLDTVEISLLQDTLFDEIDDSKQNISQESDMINLTNKEKLKRNYKELNRLDVTVIQLPDKCQYSFCKLGCICESLQYSHSIKQHCGLLKCMFGCKCGFSKYNNNNKNSETLPTLVNLNNERQLRLAKEEQKFHQTVIVSGKKRILLKANKRQNSNFETYDSSDNKVKNRQNTLIEREPSIVARKLLFKNVEIWCMVHNLYKCFCKNRFVSKYDSQSNVLNSVNDSLHGTEIKELCSDVISENTLKIVTRQGKRKLSNNLESSDVAFDDYYCSTARLVPFCGRKYSDGYYEATNRRILELEKNDRKLQQKLINKVNMIEKESNKKLNSNGNLTLTSQRTKGLLDVQSALLDVSAMTSQTPYFSNSLAKSRFITWIESNYKNFKDQLKQGIVQKTLESPKLGKFAFYSWSFILNRYKDKKNLFLVSKDKPYRIFMAVNQNHPAFKNCINIDDIRFADINKFPESVKRLLTNYTELEDNFCILRGLSHCWEFVGSAARKTEISRDDITGTAEEFSFSESSKSDSIDMVTESSALFNTDTSMSVIDERTLSTDIDSTSTDTFTENQSTESQESCRWFVMRIENDFSEIQFYRKGFFVKYESIVSAIHVARRSNRTVRISSQKCIEKNTSTQFGIYAIPNAHEFCVFVGPYETDEPLGIETVKTLINKIKPKRTRGVWITTNKIDNVNVIKNPMLYMPSGKGIEEAISICNYNEESPKSSQEKDNSEDEIKDKNEKEMIPKSEEKIKDKREEEIKYKSDEEIIDKSKQELKDKEEIKAKIVELNGKETHQKLTVVSPNIKTKAIKVVKPIKIRKVDTVYQITSKSSLLKNINTESDCKIKTNRIQLMNDNSLHKLGTSFNKSNVQRLRVLSAQSTVPKPVAQIAPQVNTDLQQSLRARDKTNTAVKSGLIILKPEEVVKILTEKKLKRAGSSKKKENFKKISNCPQDIFEISDDDETDVVNIQALNDVDCQNVRITCSTVNWTAWLPGYKNNQNLLSFTFPGDSPSIFYEEAEALSEVNRSVRRLH